MKPIPTIGNSTKKRAYHSILASFPASSVAASSTQPLLCLSEFVTKSGVGVSFYGSTFLLPYAPALRKVEQQKANKLDTRLQNEICTERPTSEELDVGRASFALKEMLNVVLVGIEHCQCLWRDGIDKERTKWIDELEEAAKSHGCKHEDVTVIQPIEAYVSP
jgi:hypothetical protein